MTCRGRALRPARAGRRRGGRRVDLDLAGQPRSGTLAVLLEVGVQPGEGAVGVEGDRVDGEGPGQPVAAAAVAGDGESRFGIVERVPGGAAVGARSQCSAIGGAEIQVPVVIGVVRRDHQADVRARGRLDPDGVPVRDRVGVAAALGDVVPGVTDQAEGAAGKDGRGRRGGRGGGAAGRGGGAAGRGGRRPRGRRGAVGRRPLGGGPRRRDRRGRRGRRGGRGRGAGACPVRRGRRRGGGRVQVLERVAGGAHHLVFGGGRRGGRQGGHRSSGRPGLGGGPRLGRGGVVTGQAVGGEGSAAPDHQGSGQNEREGLAAGQEAGPGCLPGAFDGRGLTTCHDRSPVGATHRRGTHPAVPLGVGTIGDRLELSRTGNRPGGPGPTRRRRPGSAGPAPGPGRSSRGRPVRPAAGPRCPGRRSRRGRGRSPRSARPRRRVPWPPRPAGRWSAPAASGWPAGCRRNRRRTGPPAPAGRGPGRRARRRAPSGRRSRAPRSGARPPPA